MRTLILAAIVSTLALAQSATVLPGPIQLVQADESVLEAKAVKLPPGEFKSKLMTTGSFVYQVMATSDRPIVSGTVKLILPEVSDKLRLMREQSKEIYRLVVMSADGSGPRGDSKPSVEMILTMESGKPVAKFAKPLPAGDYMLAPYSMNYAWEFQVK